MAIDEVKKQIELKVFKEFVKYSKLPVDLETIEQPEPPAPDISCFIESGGYVAFELTQISDQNAKRNVAKLLETGDERYTYNRLGDPTRELLKKKLRKRYVTEYPIELLLATGHIALTITEIVPTIELVLGSYSKSIQFRRIWVMDGKSNVKCTYGPNLM